MRQSVALLSGLLCDETFWTDIPQRLSGIAEVQVVSFRGFSSIPAMAKHVLDVSPDQFALAGHSMGGSVALEILGRAPRRVRVLALRNRGAHGVRETGPLTSGLLCAVAYERGLAAFAAG